MRYVVMTHLPPEEVLERARRFFQERGGLDLVEETDATLAFSSGDGTAKITARREYDHTNVRAETDRVVGLDVTDVTKRFLYTLEHV
ncbi:MAG: hypothetical protein ACE5HF_00330 [Gemmatimonadota bacterium]